jgi:hypothetical protein
MRSPCRTTAPNDVSPLGHLSNAELLKELAQRRLKEGKVDLGAMETFAEEAQRDSGSGDADRIKSLPPRAVNAPSVLLTADAGGG